RLRGSRDIGWGLCGTGSRLVRQPHDPGPLRRIVAARDQRDEVRLRSDGWRWFGRSEEARDLIHSAPGHAAKHLLVGSRPGVTALARLMRPFEDGNEQPPALAARAATASMPVRRQ